MTDAEFAAEVKSRLRAGDSPLVAVQGERGPVAMLMPHRLWTQMWGDMMADLQDRPDIGLWLL